ncbi:tetratricopeptide repeat-containing sulfotransferase family protein [Aliiglaciecola litoralis]|uniref:Tetratricopeptide repeat-containing sulfotransferase family protein n=1 Tax=Aliiglaciecola litoralis TaxID=582857 RepID=A0ABP3WNV0_9ALTE
MTQTLIEKAERHFQAGQLEAAKQTYLEALKHNAQNAFAYLGLGKIAFQLADYDRAITLLSQACQLSPYPQDALILLANSFNAVSSPADALTSLNYAMKQYPQSKTVLSALIQQHIRMGNVPSAESLLEQQIASDDALFSAYGWLDRVRVWHKPLSDSQWQQLRQLSEQSSGRVKMLIDYALGQAYDRVGDFQRAANHLRQANAFQLSLCDFATKQLAPFYRSIAEHFPAGTNTSKNTENETITPVFIVGLPRTGSTLLEQMLARHSQIDTVGEQPFLSNVCVPLLEKASQNRFPACLSEAAQLDRDKVAAHYINYLSKHSSAKYVINKLPANVQNVGLIFALFANAKVIILNRSMKDVSLSVFKNYFAHNEPYFCDLAQFAEFADYTEELTNHWRSQFSGQLIDIHYEALVSSPQEQLIAVMDYLGTSMESQCLDQHRTAAVVDTLSAIQVRKPISQSSVGRWRDYADILFKPN